MSGNTLNNADIFDNIGKTILGLKFEKIIGQGAHGIVYQAFDVNTKRKYAVKMIITSKITHDGNIMHDQYYTLMESFNEVNVMSHISHPYILSYRQKFVANVHFKDPNIKNIKTLFIVMDLADCSMKDIMNSKAAIPIRSKLNYIYQLLQAVSYLHKYNYFHCDIKPENILIYGNNIKLCDMGLVTNAESFSTYNDNFLCGSLSQQAPEVAAKDMLVYINNIKDNNKYKDKANIVSSNIITYMDSNIKKYDDDIPSSHIMYKKIKIAEMFSIGQTILQIYINKSYNSTIEDILDLGEFLYITCALPRVKRKEALHKLTGWSNDIKYMDDLLLNLLNANVNSRTFSCYKLLNHKTFYNFHISNNKIDIWPKSQLNYLKLNPLYFINSDQYYMVSHMYCTVLDITEYLIRNNIYIMLKTLIFVLSYIYCIIDVIHKYLWHDNKKFKILNITILLSFYLSIIYTHDFEFKIQDMLSLILEYDNTIISEEIFIPCLHELFNKLTCLYPENVYDLSSNSDEVLDMISYYLNPITMLQHSPNHYAANNKSKGVLHNKNITININIIKDLKFKYTENI